MHDEVNEGGRRTRQGGEQAFGTRGRRQSREDQAGAGRLSQYRLRVFGFTLDTGFLGKINDMRHFTLCKEILETSRLKGEESDSWGTPVVTRGRGSGNLDGAWGGRGKGGEM